MLVVFDFLLRFGGLIIGWCLYSDLRLYCLVGLFACECSVGFACCLWSSHGLVGFVMMLDLIALIVYCLYLLLGRVFDLVCFSY